MTTHSPVTVTGFTVDTMYESIVDRCVKVAADHGVRVLPVPYPARGSWWANCAAKPRILYNMAVSLRDLGMRCPLVWVDADGEILSGGYAEGVAQAIEESGGGTIGLKFRVCPRFPQGQMMGGTIVVPNVARDDCLDHLKEWMLRCEERPEDACDKTFREMHESGFPGAFDIGKRLCWVSDVEGRPTDETLVYHRRTKWEALEPMKGVVG